MVAEPLIGPFLGGVVRPRGARRILEVGCGSGVNLRHVAAIEGTTGLGVDVDPDVVAQAARNLATWGLTDRFAVAQVDVREQSEGRPPPELAGPWDLVLLMQNVYYFAGDERADLFGACGHWRPTVRWWWPPRCAAPAIRSRRTSTSCCARPPAPPRCPRSTSSAPRSPPPASARSRPVGSPPFSRSRAVVAW